MPRFRLKSLVSVVLALIALGWVFLSYLQPALIMDLSNRLWSCL